MLLATNRNRTNVLAFLPVCDHFVTLHTGCILVADRAIADLARKFGHDMTILCIRESLRFLCFLFWKSSFENMFPFRYSMAQVYLIPTTSVG